MRKEDAYIQYTSNGPGEGELLQRQRHSLGVQSTRTLGCIWVVVKIMVPVWVLGVTWHLVFVQTQQRSMILITTPMVSLLGIVMMVLGIYAVFGYWDPFCMVLATLMLMCAASFRRSAVSRVCVPLCTIVLSCLCSPFAKGLAAALPCRCGTTTGTLRD